MDITIIREKVLGWIKKYRYGLIILLVGILLMLIPSKENKETEQFPTESPDQTQQQLMMDSDQLEEILSKIKGAGNVKVLLSFASGERKVYQTDERNTTADSSQTSENETVLLTDSDRSEKALIVQVVAPEYLGAVVVCQGADDPTVRLAVADAVSKATGLGTDKISVLRMI